VVTPCRRGAPPSPPSRALLLVLVVPPAAARSIDHTVLRIVDGDTIDVQLVDRV
jgi:hypothetical protein